MGDESTVRLRASASHDEIMTLFDSSEAIQADGDEGVRRRPRDRARLLLTLATVLVCGTASFLAVVFRAKALRVAQRIGDLPPWRADAAYVSLLAVWLACLLPTSVLEIAAGFILGFWRAALCSTLGKFIGSGFSFAVGRSCRDAVRARLLPPAAASPDDASEASRGYLRGFELALRLEPFRTCLALRLAYVPEAVQNYVPAVFDAPPAAFAGATLVGGSLYALLWAKLGSQLSSASDISEENLSPEKIFFFVVGALGLAGIFVLTHLNSKRVLARWNSLETTDAAAPKPPVQHGALV